MNSKLFIVLFAIIAMIVFPSDGAILTYAGCQASCAAGAATVAGSTAFIGTPLAVASYAACQSACAATFVAPLP